MYKQWINDSLQFRPEKVIRRKGRSAMSTAQPKRKLIFGDVVHKKRNWMHKYAQTIYKFCEQFLIWKGLSCLQPSSVMPRLCAKGACTNDSYKRNSRLEKWGGGRDITPNKSRFQKCLKTSNILEWVVYTSVHTTQVLSTNLSRYRTFDQAALKQFPKFQSIDVITWTGNPYIWNHHNNKIYWRSNIFWFSYNGKALSI